MARYCRVAVAAAVAGLVLAGPVRASVQSEAAVSPPQQGRESRRDGNRRPWWKDPKDMTEIGITAEQSEEIDQIFKAEIARMRPLRETIDTLEKSLDATIRENTADVAVFSRQVQKIESKRAELNAMRTVMLYRMRRVLNAEQNARFQAMVDRWEASRRRPDGDKHH